MVASSFLPVAIHRGELYFLFGKEVDRDSMPGFSDFGGRVEPNEFLDAGIREFAEEITDFFSNQTQNAQSLNISYNLIPRFFSNEWNTKKTLFLRFQNYFWKSVLQRNYFEIPE